MKRFHVHVSVKDLSESIRFYSTVFGTPPSVQKPDYAKWMLEDPRVNFAISQRGEAAGVNHLGIQAETDEELRGMRKQAARADFEVMDQANASCCYAKSDKYWVVDPQGVAWETFHTLDSIPTFGGDGARANAQGGCCSGTKEAASAPAPANTTCCA